MEKWAFVFPGQGSQYAGMGKDFYDSYEICRETIDLADKFCDKKLCEIMFEENPYINKTRYTQLAMLSLENAILKKLNADGVSCEYTAGLSLGEYAALLCAGAISEEDAYRLIALRGRLMEEAYPEGGAMAAVMSNDTDMIEHICDKLSSEGGTVSIANYNCPGQTVITGSEASVIKAMEEIKNNGAKKCTLLKVSGPFHSRLMSDAGERLYEELLKTDLETPKIPYISNVTATEVLTSDSIRELLKDQISSAVRWQQSVERMIELGVKTFVEIGPKKSLSGFIKRISRDVNVLKIENIDEYEEVLEQWKKERL